MPANIILKNLTNPPKKAGESPKIATRSDLRDGARGAGGSDPNPTDPGEPWIFTESFDNQPNWTGADMGNSSGYAELGDSLPNGVLAARSEIQPWALDPGETAVPAISITGSPEHCRNGTGKALLCWRYGFESGWRGDGLLLWAVPPTRKIYLSVWIKFQPGWEWYGSTKLLRFMHKADHSYSQDFFNYDMSEPERAKDISPVFLFGYSHTRNYGLRNKLSFRSNAGGTAWDNPEFPDLPRSMTGGDLSLSYTTNAYDFNGDGIAENNPQIPDLVNGGVLPNSISFIASHANVYGDQWNRFEFYGELNSAPGAQDGVIAQWFNGRMVYMSKKVPWVQSDGKADCPWNLVSLGGNDSFDETLAGEPITGADKRMEWHAFDDLEVRNHLPPNRTLEPMT